MAKAAACPRVLASRVLSRCRDQWSLRRQASRPAVRLKTVLVSSYISPKARKGAASAIEGRGLIAVAPMAAGELVAIKGGHLVTTAALASLPERLRNSEIQIADGFHLAALDETEYEPVMLFLNHSCEPNVGFAGNIVLVAMRDISPG
jgi:uncharacterized protein